MINEKIDQVREMCQKGTTIARAALAYYKCMPRQIIFTTIIIVILLLLFLLIIMMLVFNRRGTEPAGPMHAS